jgi:hypothetical protein
MRSSYMQALRSVETTMIYTHVVRTMSNRPKSPLDTF